MNEESVESIIRPFTSVLTTNTSRRCSACNCLLVTHIDSVFVVERRNAKHKRLADKFLCTKCGVEANYLMIKEQEKSKDTPVISTNLIEEANPAVNEEISISKPNIFRKVLNLFGL